MKTYKERTENILSKIENKKENRKKVQRITALSLCLCLIIGAVVLFAPYDDGLPDVSRYAGNLYYDLIQKLNLATHQPPAIKNNYEYLAQMLKDWNGESLGFVDSGVDMGEAEPENTPSASTPDRGENYVETTDNQVAGVIEGDLIKRTDSHIYYLRNNTLSVYTIAGGDSVELGSFAIQSSEHSWFNNGEMYLSKDGTRVTVFLTGFGDELEAGKKQAYACIISLDVSDPAQIKEINRQYLTGSYLSSRQVDGRFLVVSQYAIRRNQMDFDDEATFVPQYGKPGSMCTVAAENIIVPDDVTSLNYTVVTVLDEQGLNVADSVALLSYTAELYVSQNHIFAAHSYTEGITENSCKTVTDITALSYSGEGLEKMGTVKLDGQVKNQYSMDEHEDILRVVTSTTETTYETVTKTDYSYRRDLSNKRNVNLYCVDLKTFTVAAQVEAFAPEGETAESVRFDGKTAYVCTAEVITLTDPVYFFDLSDLSNITWKDTGTIDGYSSSLVDFGEYLLGIGFNENQELKIEIYRETELGVESLCSYEKPVSFSQDYKSYYIDRESQLVGLGIYAWKDGGRQYVLLGFDGVQFRELAQLPMTGNMDNMRGLVIDGWLYVFGDDFAVQKVW